jgi:uncharacterized protein (DUF1015 family)
VPEIRPFRALRYERDVVGDLSAVVSPPYDVISPELQRELLERHPLNVVRLDLPAVEPGDEPDDRYRRAARTLATWRSDGTLRKDPRPSVYVYEQAYRVPDAGTERVQRSFFARLRLESFGPGSTILPHERTLSAPKEDRYKLLRATGANLSPVVALYGDPTGRAAERLASVAATRPDIEVRDADAVRHRVWIVPTPTAEGADDPARDLAAIAGADTVTIADGHHRYETALRYRDERRMTRSCEEDPAFDYLLALLQDTTSSPPTVLPTHRVVRGLRAEGLERLRAGVGELFAVEPMDEAAVVGAMAMGSSTEARAPTDGGRFGLLTRDGSAILRARRDAFVDSLPPGGVAVRRLDVSLLDVALERLCGIDATVVASGDRLAYTKSVREAADLVARRVDAADAAFLLDPTPVDDIVAVARDGDVMPQKSTFFYPKPLTGLVINPHEW